MCVAAITGLSPAMAVSAVDTIGDNLFKPNAVSGDKTPELSSV
jgi:hypothetical protein